MEPDVKVPPPLAVERVESPDAAVAFQDTDAPVEMGQPDPGGQPRHASTDDDRVVHGFGGQGY